LHDDLHQIYVEAPARDNPLYRCIDSDDDEHHLMLHRKQNNNKNLTKCPCPDPVQPASRAVYAWAEHHKRLVADAKNEPLQRELDVVFLGDSITEHWRGTKSLGVKQLPADYRQVFTKYFHGTATAERDGGGTAQLEGLALGSAGDTTTELLWHLQNGILASELLQPKVWVLLIGTNDLGLHKCSKRTTLAGILNVAQYLHQQRPEAAIILHGLLPRGDNTDEFDKSALGAYWEDIRWINRELKRFCELHPGEWFYMDASTIFLKKKPRKPGEDTKGELALVSEYMPDGLHPNVAGRELWAPLIVKQVQACIQHKQKPSPQL